MIDHRGYCLGLNRPFAPSGHMVTCWSHADHIRSHADKQVAQWDFQNNTTRTSSPGSAFVLEVPLRKLASQDCVILYHATGSCKGPITFLAIHLQRMELRDVFHPTKISANFSSIWNGTENFWKFVSKISVHLSRLSFFLEIWKFRKFPVPFGISTRYESAPVPLAVKSYKMAASLSSRHYTGCKIICHSSSLFLIAYSLRQDLIFWTELWTGRSEFPEV